MFLVSVSTTLPKVFIPNVWKLSAWSPKVWKISWISKRNPQTIPPDTKNAIFQPLQSFRPQNSKNYGSKVENDDRRNFSRKSSFSSKLSPRHLECSIDKPTGRFLMSVWKICSRPEYDEKVPSFSKNGFASESTIWWRTRLFLQNCKNFFAKFFKNFLLKVQK